MDRQMDRRFGTAFAVLRVLLWTVVVRTRVVPEGEPWRFTSLSTFPPSPMATSFFSNRKSKTEMSSLCRLAMLSLKGG